MKVPLVGPGCETGSLSAGSRKTHVRKKINKVLLGVQHDFSISVTQEAAEPLQKHLGWLYLTQQTLVE